MKVRIPGALQSYTGSGEVTASGATLAAILADLERQFPGIRFRMVDEQGRIRPHVRFFVRGQPVCALAQALDTSEELFIVQALSGG